MQKLPIVPISNLLFNLMIENNMWQKKAIFLLESIVPALIEMENKQEITINEPCIIKYLSLNEIITLSNRKDFTKETLEALSKYLNSLPGFKKKYKKLEINIFEHHGYLLTKFYSAEINGVRLNKVFEIACLSQKAKIIIFFIEHFPDENPSIQKGFISCCSLGLIDNIKFFLNHPKINIDIFQNDNICFKVATYCDQFSTVNYLITEFGVKVFEQLKNWSEQLAISLDMKDYVQQIIQAKNIKEKLELQLVIKEDDENQLIKI